MKHLFVTTILISTLVLSGCWKNPETEAIENTVRDTYYQQLCLRYSLKYPFDLYVTKNNEHRIERAEVLVADGILERSETREFVPNIGYTPKRTYSLTSKGAKQLNNNLELCYAERTASKIIAIEPVNEKSSYVTFEISDTYLGEWAQHPFFKKFTTLESPKTLRRLVTKDTLGGYKIRGSTEK